MSRRTILRLLIGGLALFGAYSGAQISWVHATGVESCPMVGPVPACYLVLAGYMAMLISVTISNRAMFIVGLVPVFLLATTGVVGEIISAEPVCPQTADGIPKCFFSFGIASALAVMGLMLFRSPKQ